MYVHVGISGHAWARGCGFQLGHSASPGYMIHLEVIVLVSANIHLCKSIVSWAWLACCLAVTVRL